MARSFVSIRFCDLHQIRTQGIGDVFAYIIVPLEWPLDKYGTTKLLGFLFGFHVLPFLLLPVFLVPYTAVWIQFKQHAIFDEQSRQFNDILE